MNAMFSDYASNGPAYDEMFDGTSLRPPYQRLRSSLRTMTTPELVDRVEALQSAYLDQGVTFDIGGEERAFPLDILPRVIERDSWATIDAGVQQRVRTLEAFLEDVYGAGEVFEDGVVPREVVTTSSHYHREAAGIRAPNGVRVHVSGIDLIRDNAGEFRVLEDNVRVPSGVSYVMTNRRAISAALPETVAEHRIRPVQGYPQRLLAALRAAAPAGVEDPTVVVLTPGVYNGAYFEHALLARTMGVELVEGRDLVCRRGRVMMRTTQGLAPVHVIYRRVDDEFLDPVHFRGDSVLGCPGMIDAARSGNVTLANAVGNGVADDKLVYTYLPALVRYYLGEEPVLRNVDTWRMGDRDHREEVLDRLDELVLKPVDGSGGKGIVIGPRASRAELDELRTKVLDDPRSWIAQPVVQLSTVPTFVDGRLGPRHVDLRPFAVNDGNRVWVLPGGLTRVALAEGELIVNSSRGGGSKDTWVLAGPAHPEVGAAPDVTAPGSGDREAPEVREAGPTPSEPPAPGPGLQGLRDQSEQQQQQQQQQQERDRRAPGGRRRRAEQDRGVDVLDRALRRAGGGHRADARHPDPAAAGGPRGRRGGDLPGAAVDHGGRGRPRGAGRRRGAARGAGLRPRLPHLDRVRAGQRPRERAPGAGDAVGAAVGGAEHDVPDVGQRPRPGPVPADATAGGLRVGAGAGGADQRHRGRDDDP